MKLPFISTRRVVRAGVVATACLLALPQAVEAKPKWGKPKKAAKHHPAGIQVHTDHDRNYYHARPVSSFVLSFGSGYAGRGYYYGPPNAVYYYERPGVRYYANREVVPHGYYARESSMDAAVQRALARRGYYEGPIDGAIGPQSRRAISRYQYDYGLQETGTITDGLLASLGL